MRHAKVVVTVVAVLMVVAMASAQADTKRRLADQDRLLQQAQVDENEAVNALTQEQSRWGDLNRRLDDLERSLGAR